MNDKYKYGLAIAAVLAVIYFVKGKSTPVDTAQPPVKNPTPQTQVVVNNQIIVLDGSLMLSVGSSGNEVKELQRLLGVDIDGSFGTQTQTALFNKKGLKQTTLYQYQNTPDRVPHNFKLGDTLVVNAPNGVIVNTLDLQNDVDYVYTGDHVTLQNNDVAGEVVQLTVNTDQEPGYVVKQSGYISDTYLAISEKYVR